MISPTTYLFGGYGTRFFFFGVRSSGVPGAKSQLGDSGKTFLVDASGTILSAVQIQDSAAEAIFLSELVGESELEKLQISTLW
jgi:hypothetical protein